MKDVEQGESKFKLELKCWYATNNQTKLDRQLSSYDENDCAVSHYCAPYCTHWSYFLPASTNNNGGCMTKSEFLMNTVTCLVCNVSTEKCDEVNKTGEKLRNISKEGTYNELSKISVRTNSDYHKGIYDAIASFKKDGKRFLTEFQKYETFDDYLDLHFSHLDPALHNIFKPNEKTD